MSTGRQRNSGAGWRSLFVLGCFVVAGAVLEGRILYLQLVDQEFLEAQGDDRQIRTVEIAAHRGPITDRYGEPLAVSTPVDSVYANPKELKVALDRLPELAAVLGIDAEQLARRITSNLEREFVYLKRHLPPHAAAQVLALGLPGIGTLREYRRYYPAGEVTGHVLGFTDVDDRGQEGLELAYDYWLAGENGRKRVRQDRLGRIVEDIELVSAARPGRELRTSLDLRLQYLAYRELKAAVSETGAKSGSVVVLDVRTGEVLAMVNQPSYNPNDRSQYQPANYRNRAVTDIFEPGSSFKPLVIAAALESGRFTPDSIIDTSPGSLRVSARLVVTESEHANYGPIDLATLLAKSSNVGAAQVALALEPAMLWEVLTRLGIGRLTGSGFPGESAGVLNEPQHWRAVGQATLSYGYGLSATALQLARAYAAIGAHGVLRPVTFLPVTEPPAGEQAISQKTADALLDMLETVVTEGTGQRAQVRNYRIAGKTGTARKAGAGGYSNDRHRALFAGLAPAGNPRLAVVVVLEEPQGGRYYGGEVAAPVFSRVVAGALRILAVPPDAIDRSPETVMALAGLEP
ncbi:MAG TPA: penicillin-binding transpeptidase domain-containing protein [Gammaproteobacteria bacterium]